MGLSLHAPATVTLPARAAGGEERVTVTQAFVDGGYFDLLGIPDGRGTQCRHSGSRPRGGPRQRSDGAPILARGSPLGGTIRLSVERAGAPWVWNGASWSTAVDELDHQIVGIVRDGHLTRLGEVEPMLFRVHAESDQTFTLLVPQPIAANASAIVQDLDGRASVSVSDLSEPLESEILSTRRTAQLVTALASSLLLATTGVYGVIAYSVEGRRREIGIRMALGAAPRDVIRDVIARNTRAVVAGLAAGLVLSLVATSVFVSRLYGLSRLDPAAYAGVLLILLAAGVAASALPARRAARIDPINVLQAD